MAAGSENFRVELQQVQDGPQAGGYQAHQSCSCGCQYPVGEQNGGNCQNKPANFRARCKQALHFYILIQIRKPWVEGSINHLTGLPGKGHYAGIAHALEPDWKAAG